MVVSFPRRVTPVILHLGRWGDRAPLPHGARAGLDSLLLAIQAAADPARVSGRYELRIDDVTFVVDGSSGSVRIRRGTADRPDATVTTDGGTFRAVIFGQLPIAGVVRAGGLRLDGDPDATSRLTDLLLTLTASPQLAGAGRADEA